MSNDPLSRVVSEVGNENMVLRSDDADSLLAVEEVVFISFRKLSICFVVDEEVVAEEELEEALSDDLGRLFPDLSNSRS